MVIKTFNVTEDVYSKFSNYCKDIGLSMSKQIDMFMKSQIEEDKSVREEYLKKLEAIRKGNFVNVKGSLMNRY